MLDTETTFEFSRLVGDASTSASWSRAGLTNKHTRRKYQNNKNINVKKMSSASEEPSDVPAAIAAPAATSEVVVDALPYIDHGYDEPGVREAVSRFRVECTIWIFPSRVGNSSPVNL